MLWFLLFGFLGYLIYKIYRHYWFRALRKKIAKFSGLQYRRLSPPDKQTLRDLVERVLDSGITLDDETNKIVGDAYKDIEEERFYQQGGLGLGERANGKRH